MSSLFNKYAEKAQHALNATPLGQYIPANMQPHGQQEQQQGAGGGTSQPTSHTGSSPARPTSPPASSPSLGRPQTQAATPPAGASGGGSSIGGGVAGVLRQHGFSSLQNQLRTLQVQYSKGNDRQIQLAITAQKSVSLDFEGAGRDAQMYAKELYLWGQEQPEDIKDVTDRLAYLNFMHGSLNTDLANKLDTARGPWKTARATEGTAGTLKQTNQATDAIMGESEVERRNALKLGEAARWKAIREYAEKLIILSQASEVLVEECLPASGGQPYTAKQRTAEIRSNLQKSIDNWRPDPAIAANSPFKGTSSTSTPASGLLDPRSFGETHRAELERTPSVVDKQRADQEALANHARQNSDFMPPATGGRPAPTTTSPSGSRPNPPSTGVNPSQLNNAPAPVPVPASTASTGGVPGLSQSPPRMSPLAGSGSPTIPPTAPLNIHKNTPPSSASLPISSGAPPPSFPSATSPVGPASMHSDSAVPADDPSSHPTMAETGVPIVSPGGPGPASGSLKRPDAGVAGLAGAAAVGAAAGWGDPTPPSAASGLKYETAEEEKARLEKEARERYMRFGTGVNKPQPAVPTPDTSAPPPTSSSSTAAPGAQKWESAEEEKKRLEREQRERVLSGQGSSGPSGPSSGGPPPPPGGPEEDGDALPSYKPY